MKKTKVGADQIIKKIFGQKDEKQIEAELNEARENVEEFNKKYEILKGSIEAESKIEEEGKKAAKEARKAKHAAKKAEREKKAEEKFQKELKETMEEVANFNKEYKRLVEESQAE